MNLSPTQLVHLAHGAPQVDSCSEHGGICYVCSGKMSRGAPVGSWMGSNYTDQNRVRSPLSTHVCESCCYVHSRTSPVLGRPPKDGKKFGGNFRNYSHLFEDGWSSPVFGDDGSGGSAYANASKGQKLLIREFLAREHKGAWFASVADSGQKHVLPFAPMNGPGSRAGVVIFEEALVSVPDDQSLIVEMTSMLTDGVTKEEIETGNYYVRTMRERRELAQAFEQRHGAMRGSEWFRLAIWLSQRDEEEFQRRDATRKEEDARRKAKAKTRNTDSGDAPRAPKRVPRSSRRETANGLLEPNPEPVPRRSSPVDNGKRVGVSGAKAPTDPGPAQCRLPGFD